MTSKTESDEAYWYASSGMKYEFDGDSDEVLKTFNQFKQDANPTQNTTAQPFPGLLVLSDASVDSSGHSSGDSLKSARYQHSAIGSFTASTDLKEHFSPSSVSATEVAKLEAEVRHLRRKSKDVPSVDDVILKIIFDEPYFLEEYRSRELKVGLLDAAIKYHDGNAIIRTLLHLKHNTKPSIFSQEIIKRPEAVNHYISYLKLQGLHSELSDLLQLLGRTDEAAMVQYKVALNTRNTESAIKRLVNCLRNHFQHEPSLVTEASLVQEHLTLLEKQLPIEISDAAQEKAKNVATFIDFPRQMPLVNQSVLDTLYYCCLYHYDLKENHYASPVAIRKEHHLNHKQFSYTACAALARQQRWKLIDELILTKSYLGKLKLRSDISISSILELLHRKGASPQILQHYIRNKDNVEARLELAKQYKCHDVVIEALTRLKDREQLRAYAEKLPRMSSERRHAESALSALHS